MQSRETRILKNSIIFTVGNLGSKVFSYVMVLVYTYFINSVELGYYDIILTTVSLLQPIVLLSFDEGIYRWLIDTEKKDIKRIIATCVKTIGCSTAIALAIFGLVHVKFHFQYAIDIVLLFASSLIYQLALSAVRGLSNNKLYALSGVLNSFFLLLFEVVGLIFLRMGVEALLLSKAIANILTLVFIYAREPHFHGFFQEKCDRKLAGRITSYTAPLIPNSISWWVVNSSDKYIILAFLGASFNGIYSVANKFPTVVTTISSILYFALQEAVIKEYRSPDRDQFYSSIFEKYYLFLFSLVLCGIPSTKLVISYLTGNEYRLAWQYTGFLFMSTVFSALSSFLGIGYQISRETVKSAYTTIVAAAINILTNMLLVHWIGLHAAAFSTFISYLILFAVRIIHCKKYFTLNICWRRFGAYFFMVLVFAVVSYVGQAITNSILLLGGIILLIVANREWFDILLKKLKKR